MQRPLIASTSNHVQSATARVDAWVITFWVFVKALPDVPARTWRDHIARRVELFPLIGMCTRGVHREQKDFLQEPRAFHRLKAQRVRMGECVFGIDGWDHGEISATFDEWSSFIVSRIAGVYLDESEGLGATVIVPIEQGTRLRGMTGVLTKVDATVATAHVDYGQRWSMLAYSNSTKGNVTNYLAGPASLINHACFRHSNVVMEVYSSQLKPAEAAVMKVAIVADKYIAPGSRLYACYDTDAESLERERGLRCRVCILQIK